MKIKIKKIAYLFVIPLALLCMQSAYSQPLMVPGFMGIESSYMEEISANSDSSNAFFSISNFHHEPIILLSATGDSFESATFIGPNGNELEQVIIEPGNRLVMGPNSVHLRLGELDAATAEDYSHQISLLIRRGLEAEEEVEAIEELGAMSGVRSREAGIPNEREFVVNVPVNH